MNKEKQDLLKSFTKELIKSLGINLSPFLLIPIFSKIDNLTDEEIQKIINLIHQFF